MIRGRDTEQHHATIKDTPRGHRAPLSTPRGHVSERCPTWSYQPTSPRASFPGRTVALKPMGGWPCALQARQALDIATCPCPIGKTLRALRGTMDHHAACRGLRPALQITSMPPPLGHFEPWGKG